MILLALAFAPAGLTFACDVSRVSDGDTWKCSSGMTVRAAGIDAPEMPGHCRRGRHCVPGDPFASKRALEQMIAGQTLRCVSNGSGKFGRTGAWCYSPRVGDVSCALVRAKVALVWRVFWKGHDCHE